MRLLAAALLALMLPGCGGGGVPDPGPGPGPERIDFNGTVRDASGTPIAGAAVLVGLNATTTDAAGHFSYPGLLPGAYTISLQDGAGNFDCREVTLSVGASDLDFTLPSTAGGFRVVSVAPALGSTGAALDGVIAIEFSGDLNLTSLHPEDIQVTPDVGTLSTNAMGSKLELTHHLQLPLNQQMLVELTGSVSSSDGTPLSHPLRWRFRTSAADNYAPQLIGTTPPDGATNHPPNSAVRFEFNEPLGEVDGGFELSVVPPIELTPVTSGRYLNISAVGGWEINTHYVLRISGVTDPLGNRATEEHGISFTTGDQPASRWHIQPEWNAVADIIVFSADTGGSFDVFSIHPDGGTSTQLTMLPGDALHPTLSSDGTILAYQHNTAGKWSIFVQDLGEGGEAVQITASEFNDTEPYFSRTLSNRIAYVSDISSLRGLYLANVDGSNPVEQDRDFGTEQTQPALHPLLDTQLLFTSSYGGDRDIWRKTVSAIDGTAINQNLSGDMLSDEHSPAWGPDAGYFVFISDFGGMDNLWYAEATGEFPRQLTEFAQPAADPCVSPVPGDARCVLSVANDNGGSDLVIVDLVSGAVVRYLTGEEAGD